MAMIKEPVSETMQHKYLRHTRAGRFIALTRPWTGSLNQTRKQVTPQAISRKLWAYCSHTMKQTLNLKRCITQLFQEIEVQGKKKGAFIRYYLKTKASDTQMQITHCRRELHSSAVQSRLPPLYTDPLPPPLHSHQ